MNSFEMQAWLSLQCKMNALRVQMTAIETLVVSIQTMVSCVLARMVFWIRVQTWLINQDGYVWLKRTNASMGRINARRMQSVRIQYRDTFAVASQDTSISHQIHTG